MLAPLSWIKEFTPVALSAEEIADVLTDLGLVVEGVELVGENLDGVVVGHVLDVRTHPDADKVRLADVDLGDGEALQIACGAANLEVGQLVPVATIGTVLPGGLEIERRKLRGEWSNGMICSSDELGLTRTRAAGIMVLPQGLTVGAPFKEAMGVEPDAVFDLAIETNRPDAMCIAGVARDLAGRLRLPFSIPRPEVREGSARVEDLASVTVERPDIAWRFVARVLTNVRVGPSPEVIARRLTLAGMRPINNIVDASNYVMLELGQPSHPFDLDLLTGRGLRVRAAREGETLTTLDDKVRTLAESDGVITDANDSIVAIAGIMGGSSSEISETTSTVLNETAVWDPYLINYTSRRLALRTDASARFERRVDPEGVERAQARFAEIVQMSSPDSMLASGVIDVTAQLPPPVKVTVRTERVNKVLGTQLTDGQIRNYLTPIGFTTTATNSGVNEVTIPSFRPDSESEVDIIEEVARMHGYSNIEPRVSMSPFAGGLDPLQKLRRHLRSWLTGRGITEAWSATLLSSDDFLKANQSADDAIDLANPIVAEESKLRTSLLPPMLRAVAFNATRRNSGVQLFDIGHVFNQPLQGEALPHETERMAVVLARPNDDATQAASLWRDLVHSFRVEGIEVVNEPSAGLHPTRSARLRTADGTLVGTLGEVDPDVLTNFDIPRRVGWVEVEVGAILANIEPTPQMNAISRFPAAEFDLAFLVPDGIEASTIEKTLGDAVGKQLEQLELFDVFHGSPADVGQRSLAYRLTISSLESTLKDTEVAAIRTRAIEAVERIPGVTMRA